MAGFGIKTEDRTEVLPVIESKKNKVAVPGFIFKAAANFLFEWNKNEAIKKNVKKLFDRAKNEKNEKNGK